MIDDVGTLEIRRQLREALEVLNDMTLNGPDERNIPEALRVIDQARDFLESAGYRDDLAT